MRFNLQLMCFVLIDRTLSTVTKWVKCLDKDYLCANVETLVIVTDGYCHNEEEKLLYKRLCKWGILKIH